MLRGMSPTVTILDGTPPVLDPVTMDYFTDRITPTFLSDHVLRDNNGEPLKERNANNNGLYLTRPYLSSDLWNTPIGSATVDSNSADYVAAIWGDIGNPRRWNLNPNTYTYGVYVVSSGDELRTVTYTGVYSEVSSGGVLTKDTGGGTTQVPIPLDAMNSSGSDSSIIIINPDTHEEWGFWRLTNNRDGTFSATNGYKVYTNVTAYQPSGFGSRGGGLSYLTGLVRPHEIAAGEITHALAFAYDKGTASYIPPITTKSDGSYVGADGLPYGARLRLDPSISEATIRSWAVNSAESDALYIIARAMQVYGMFLVDYSGSVKIMAEDNLTANWADNAQNRYLTSRTLRNIPTLDVIQVLSISGVVTP